MSISSSSNASLEEILSSDDGSISLDNSHEYFFEGAEKLLKICFDKDHGNGQSLRVIPYDELAAMLEIAQCHILHSESNECMDSYVLSESSMFIFDTRMILKTCGSTQLLHALNYLLHLVQKYCNMETVVSVFYSRKNFLRPERQPFLHRKFEREIDYLDRYFQDGSAYCLGSLKHDRWFLYTMTLPHAHALHPDHTLEILMTEMPDEILSVFTKAMCMDGKECTKKSGIDRIVPFGTVIHEELFTPCGYSMNGLLPKTDQYVTIHITPEPEFSYVSFETNQSFSSLYKQTLKVIDLFKPNKFLMTVFANELSIEGKETQQCLWERPVAGYKRVNVQLMKLEYETLIYAQFARRKATSGKNVLLKRMITEDDGNSD